MGCTFFGYNFFIYNVLDKKEGKISKSIVILWQNVVYILHSVSFLIADLRNLAKDGF